MKKIHGITTVIALVAALALILLPGCGGGGGGAPSAARRATGSAKLSFVMPGGSSARSAARTLDKIPDNTTSITIGVDNDSLAAPLEQQASGAPGEVVSVEIPNIPVGETTFKINALDAAGTMIAGAYEVVTISEGNVSMVYAELGIVTDGALTKPSTFTLAAGETLNVKNISDVNAFPLTIPNTTCPAATLTFGRNGQLSCTFPSAGTYTVMNSGTTLATITVTAAAGGFLTANASVDKGYGQPPLTAQFAGGAVCDACSGVTYAWDFGDGGASTAQNPSHAFSAAGDYVVTLTVTDSAGATNQDRVMVHVGQPPAPVVASVSPASGASNAATAIMIFGDNFQTGAEVLIGTTSATGVTVSSGAEIAATVPAGLPTGVYDVTVTNPDGQSGVLPAAFTVGGAAYTAADFVSLASGNSWSYLTSGVNDTNSLAPNEPKTRTILGTETVNGATCTQYGESPSEYDCISVDATSGLLVHKNVDINNGVQQVLTFDPPITYLPASFSVGDTFSSTSTQTEVNGGGTPVAGTLTYSLNMVAAESVFTPAGIFDAIKYTFTRTDAARTVTQTSWIVSGLGYVKTLEVGEDNCPADGCLAILDYATVNATPFPAPLAAGAMDGQYWMASMRALPDGSYVSSGYSDMTVSGNTLTVSSTESNFMSTSPATSNNTLTVQAYNNGTFTISEDPTMLGVFNSSGNGGIMTMGPSVAGIMVFTPKATTYTASMVVGDYYVTTYGVETGGGTYVEEAQATMNADLTYSFTGTLSNSSGSNRVPDSGTGTYTVNTTNGTFVYAGDAGTYLGMIGAGGNVLLYSKYGTGGREISIYVRKGSGLSAGTVAGPFLGIFLGKDSSFWSSMSYVNFKADGTVEMLDKESIQAGTGTYTVDAAGLFTMSTNPDGVAVSNSDGTLGLSSTMDPAAQETGFLVKVP